MSSFRDAFISIRPEFIEKILTGEKRIELRRRRPNMAKGTRLWLYASAPKCEVMGISWVADVVTATPQKIWKQFNSQAGVSLIQFQEYFDQAEQAHAIVLQKVTTPSKRLDLKTLRRTSKSFHPPQFYCWIDGDGPLPRLLASAA